MDPVRSRDRNYNGKNNMKKDNIIQKNIESSTNIGSRSTSNGMEAKIYNKKGKEVGLLELPQNVFGAKWRSDLVHQVVEAMRSNRRRGTADTKGRGEVRGGGKKPWKQKGTGRARHGSSRSPIWVGGGVTHGPLAEKNYKRKISKKMGKEALYSVLSRKLKDEEILFVDSFSMDAIKTKEGEIVVNNLASVLGAKNYAKAKNPKFLIALFEKNENTKKSLRNLPFIDMVFVKNLNPLDILNHKYLLIENGEESVKFLSKNSI